MFLINEIQAIKCRINLERPHGTTHSLTYSLSPTHSGILVFPKVSNDWSSNHSPRAIVTVMKDKAMKKSKHSKSSKHSKHSKNSKHSKHSKDDKKKRKDEQESLPTESLLTMNDYFSMNKLFRYYLVNEKKKNFEDYTSAEAHKQFEKFIKLYNKKELSSVYYTNALDVDTLHEAIKTSHNWNINITGTEKKEIAVITSSSLSK